MSCVVVTSTPAVVAGGVILRLLATCRELRTIVESSMQAAEVRAMLGTRDVHAGTRVSFIAADSEDDPGRLDAAAGCEFVDDRLRLRE